MKNGLKSLVLMLSALWFAGCGPEQSVDRTAPKGPDMSMRTPTPPPIAAATCADHPTIAIKALPSTTLVNGRVVAARFSLTSPVGIVVEAVNLSVASTVGGTYMAPSLRVVGSAADLPGRGTIGEPNLAGHNIALVSVTLDAPLTITSRSTVDLEFRLDAAGFRNKDELWTMVGNTLSWRIASSGTACTEMPYDFWQPQTLTF